MPFDDAHNYTDPNDALNFWYKLFLSVLDTHAPIKRKRVKHLKLPQWLTHDIKQAMARRDQLKKSKNFVEYKKSTKSNKEYGSGLKTKLF
jgi:hypothetical protein